MAAAAYAVAPQKEFAKIAEGPYRVVGVDERPNSKWLKKTWQKLGFYLHAKWPFSRSATPTSSVRPFLEKTLADLAPLVNNNFSAMMSMNQAFTCAGCGATVKVLEKAIESSHEAVVCLTCGMPFRVEKSDGGFTFFPDEPPFTCDCGASTFVPSRPIKVGYRFSCRSCKQQFQIVGLDWKYAVVADDAEVSESQEG